MRENKKTEFKETLSSTFLKTVSAYANYDGGSIFFGVDDNGKAIGVDDIDDICIKIENRINTTINPQPEYSITSNNNDRTIELKVKPGNHKPYLYNNKAYKRNDTSTIEVDDIELRRLILVGEHMTYESQPTKDQKLSFELLKMELKEQLKIERFDKDLLKTLNLYNDERGYNNAAGILADTNYYSGIDIAKFGETISVIQKRVTIERQSILSAYRTAVEMYKDYYELEEIIGDKRRKVQIIPESAFREAVANAIIHREWDVYANIRISMFDDRIEIVSPGGLPSGISNDEYKEGRVSVLRNPIIANVFNRLNIVETFGTGVLRIKETYVGSVSQPDFDAGDNSIKVVLPVIKEDMDLDDDERAVYDILSKAKAMPISEIMKSDTIEFGKSKTTELLKKLRDKGIIEIEGNGRGTKYRKTSEL